MSQPQKPCAPSMSRVEPSTWLIFLFLTALFFVSEHNVLYTQAGMNSYNPSKTDIIQNVTEGSWQRQIALLSLGLFGAACWFRQRQWFRRPRIQGFLGAILTGFAAWTLLSLIWAEDTALTFTRVAVFAILCLGALAIARRFSSRETIIWTCFSTMAFLVAGLCAEIYLGTFHPLSPDYRFSGTVHPNLQGVNCALLVLSGIAARDSSRVRQRIFWACALVGLIFLLLSGSRTATTATVAAVVVYRCVVMPNLTRVALTLLLIAIATTSLLAFGDALIPDLRSAVELGRKDANDESFNGRTKIWTDLGYYIGQRPIIGYGYGGFWSPTHVSEISDEEKWGVPDSHSAYIDSVLNLGAVGLTGYALLLIAGMQQAFRLRRLTQNPTYAFFVALLAFYILDGFLESSTVNPSFYMFVGIVVLIQLASVPISRLQVATGTRFDSL